MSHLLNFFTRINDFLSYPAAIILISVGVYLTIATNFLQLRAFNRLYQILTRKSSQHTQNAINPFHALFTALSTTLGMGNIIGPSIAIVTGGPGALFWLVVYAFFGGIMKYCEVTFAVSTRIKTTEKEIVGGPMRYLSLLSPSMASWYGYIMVILFIGWSSLQANTLSGILAIEGIPPLITGSTLTVIVLLILHGGAQRIGSVASKLVPIMCVLYISFALFILFSDIPTLIQALQLIASNICNSSAATGGFLGATVFQALRAGIYKSTFITEAGLGTSSIPHAIADTKHPSDQGILAMYSILADTFLSIMSGLVVIVTGTWNAGVFSNTMIYEAFKSYTPVPHIGQFVLLASITLFVLTTIIGNSFNGGQCLASLKGKHAPRLYYTLLTTALITGALISVPLIWAIMDTVLMIAALLNLIGLVLLSLKFPKMLRPTGL